MKTVAGPFDYAIVLLEFLFRQTSSHQTKFCFVVEIQDTRCDPFVSRFLTPSFERRLDDDDDLAAARVLVVTAAVLLLLVTDVPRAIQATLN